MIYHISGCGVCDECQHGYMISCRSGSRAAYGWQRDGGHAPYLLAEENTCIRLPDSLSYIDGAFCACGFGTAYEALRRMQVSGHDRLLITGLGPVGLAAAMLGRALGATTIIGTDLSENRLALAGDLGLVDVAIEADDGALDEILRRTGGHGCEASIDCSGAAPARLLALQGTRDWGRCAYVGEGGTVSFEVSKYLIHKQITLFGSWVTSLQAPGGAGRAARPLGPPSRPHLHAQAAPLGGRQRVRAGGRGTDRKSLHRVRGLKRLSFHKTRCSDDRNWSSGRSPGGAIPGSARRTLMSMIPVPGRPVADLAFAGLPALHPGAIGRDRGGHKCGRAGARRSVADRSGAV